MTLIQYGKSASILKESEKQQAYMSFVKDHEGIIYKVIGLYADAPHQKKDMYQEILLQGWCSFDNFRRESSFATWLYKVSFNTVMNLRRKESRHRQIENSVNEQNEDSFNNSHSELLYLIIRSLNEVDRMLVTLHLDGYKNKEIAEITGMTLNNTTVKLHRLKTKVIEKFKKLDNE